MKKSVWIAGLEAFVENLDTDRLINPENLVTDELMDRWTESEG